MGRLRTPRASRLVIEEGDAAELAHALGVVARARGMTAVAESAGIGREAMYKALRPGASPRFDTIARVCKALSVRLVALPTQGPAGSGRGGMSALQRERLVSSALVGFGKNGYS